MRAVAEAVVKYDCPATVNPPVVDAFVNLPCVAKRVPVVVLLVKREEVAKIFCVKRLRKRRVEDPREKVSVTEGVVLPAIWRRSVGVVTPIPTFPLAKIVKSDTPVEEATLNGLSPVDVALCTLSVKVEDVALIPSTVPLSIRVEVPTVVEVSQRVA